MMIHLVNYSQNFYKQAQNKNSYTGYKFGNFDFVHSYNQNLLPQFYLDLCSKTIDYMNFVNKRGAGYWFWKPFVIYDVLNKVDEGDFVFYCDSGAYFTGSCHSSVDLMNDLGINVMCYVLDSFHTDRVWSRQDTRFILDSNSDELLDSPQIMATHIFLRNCLETKVLISNWMTYCQDLRVLWDEPSQIKKEESCFKESRHDQSIWSILCKKRKYLTFKDPSGIVPIENISEEVVLRSKYDTWICNPRDRR
jgi:hypothetical protein